MGKMYTGKGAVEMSKVLQCRKGREGKGVENNLSFLSNGWDCVKRRNAVMPVTASGNEFPGAITGQGVLPT